MEKSHNYPQMPPQMNFNGAGGSENMMTAPPSYEQATTNFPPVQVLPTPNANNFASNPSNGPPQPQPHPQGTQVYVGGTSAPYVGVSVGGTGAMPVNPPRSYPSQQTGPHQPMMQQPVIIIQQQAVLPLGLESTYVLCPACQVQSMTRISHEPSSMTHLLAALLCILGFWCCVCVPYCADSCMNTNHYCGNCNKFLGTYSDSR